MDLSRVPGFPLWLREVFGELQAAFADITALFSHYARTGGVGISDTLQQSELVTLALDTGLASEDAFPMARILSLYAIADGGGPPVRGMSAKGVGKGAARSALKLHSFMELLVLVSFYRANPAVPLEAAAAAADDEEAPEAGAAQVEAPLPGCLQMMLAKHVLKAAKREELAMTRRLMEKEEAVAVVLAKARPALQRAFEHACAKRRERSRALFGRPVLSRKG